MRVVRNPTSSALRESRKPNRPLRVLPRDLRREVQQRTIARLLLLGWDCERIARKMGCTSRAIRYNIDRQDFEILFATLQREQTQQIERKLTTLLDEACAALQKMLVHKDWRARDAALGHVLQVHGKYDGKQLTLPGQIRSGDVKVLTEGEWTEEMRGKARELLAMQREVLQKSLPAKFASHEPDSHDDRHSNGNGNQS